MLLFHLIRVKCFTSATISTLAVQKDTGLLKQIYHLKCFKYQNCFAIILTLIVNFSQVDFSILYISSCTILSSK